MKDRFTSSSPKFSQQRNITCMKERRKKIPKEKVRLFKVLFISLFYALFKFSAYSPSMPKIHFIPLLFTGSLAIDNWDHLRSGDHLWYVLSSVIVVNSS